MAYVFLVIGILALAGAIYFGIVDLRKFVKDEKRNVLSQDDKIKWWLLLGCSALSGAFLQASINTFCAWEMSNLQSVLSIGGAGIFSLAMAILWTCFYLRYYKPGIEQKTGKWVKTAMFSAIPFAVLFFLIMMEGVAEHLSYPLVSGFSISSQRFFNYITENSAYSGGVKIAFYGVIMVFSAIVVYWICDHRFYQEFHKHGILDTPLLICFPAGVIGARIGYVIGNWNGDATTTFAKDGSWSGGMEPFWHACQNGNWIKLFAIWEGGLTILGGAIGGIIAGVIFFKLRRKYVNLRWAMDVVIPTILIAQAIGRWGNFFNHEVYGAATDMSSWSFLPTWVRYQMATGFLDGKPTSTAMYVPLFLIESLINLAGYFLIRYGVGKGLKKFLAKGDLAACYLIFYGIVRIIMEPLRDVNYLMGSGGNWSIIWSGIYIGLGFLLILYFHLYDYFSAKKQRALEAQEGYQPALEVKEVPAIDVEETPALEEAKPEPEKVPAETKKSSPSPQEAVDAPLPLDKKDKK